ncbi:hypothetical protein A9K55_005872 [Cordyceps militaris]|uniref:Uncharacterized protein n=1 Tax=Cordyceps militaris TaxID=73501 RepID=A0A2H4SDS2_CORMI|nr:hypothetical protein A9K55_005872 [Cordyceps militaris]
MGGRNSGGSGAMRADPKGHSASHLNSSTKIDQFAYPLPPTATKCKIRWVNATTTTHDAADKTRGLLFLCNLRAKTTNTDDVTAPFQKPFVVHIRNLSLALPYVFTTTVAVISSHTLMANTSPLLGPREKRPQMTSRNAM